MLKLYRYLATSRQPLPRLARKIYFGIDNFTLPTPMFIAKPILWVYVALRSVYYWIKRVFVCEPIFRAYCKQCGRGVTAGVFIHWIQGTGDLIVGNRVTFHGKCNIGFSTRYTDRPVFQIGDCSSIGPGCDFTIGRRITIGRHCMIAGGTVMLDSNGHPADPQARLARVPPPPEEVRPIEIGDNVWIGMRSTICPGVKIGDGSIVSGNSVVRSSVRPYTVVAGNPARKVADLPRPDHAAPPADECRSSGHPVSANGQIATAATTGQTKTGEA
jgi:acetyltransferase-like isoleucine patch superfamily enzyme